VVKIDEFAVFYRCYIFVGFENKVDIVAHYVKTIRSGFLLDISFTALLNRV